MKEPTDLQVLRALLAATRKVQQKEYAAVGDFFRVEIRPVADAVGLSERDLANRLLYHLNPIYISKHGGNGPLTEYRQIDGVFVNLARVAALYANLSADDHRQRLTLWVALGAFMVSFVALCVSTFKPSEPVRVTVEAPPCPAPCPDSSSATAPEVIPVKEAAREPALRPAGAPVAAPEKH